MALAGISFARAKLSLHADAIFSFTAPARRGRGFLLHVKGKAAKGKNC